MVLGVVHTVTVGGGTVTTFVAVSSTGGGFIHFIVPSLESEVVVPSFVVRATVLVSTCVTTTGLGVRNTVKSLLGTEDVVPLFFVEDFFSVSWLRSSEAVVGLDEVDARRRGADLSDSSIAVNLSAVFARERAASGSAFEQLPIEEDSLDTVSARPLTRAH